MRVIAGKARRLPLKTLPGLNTRPTSDKIKETLFNILSPDIYGCNFLDLFSGSGAIAIEALSRDAKHAVLVENNRACVKIIDENLEFTKLKDSADVYSADASYAVRVLNQKNEKFDIIFMDPPYNKDFEKQILSMPEFCDLLNPAGIVVVEASVETDFSFVDNIKLRIYKEKIYKNNKHVFMCLEM